MSPVELGCGDVGRPKLGGASPPRIDTIVDLGLCGLGSSREGFGSANPRAVGVLAWSAALVNQSSHSSHRFCDLVVPSSATLTTSMCTSSISRTSAVGAARAKMTMERTRKMRATNKDRRIVVGIAK